MQEELIHQLIDRAWEAKDKARVVKSNFHVGAAVLTEDGSIVTGCNVELGNILMSICAERCAIVKAISLGHQKFKAIAVVSDSPKPVAPCGICRQFLLDFGADIEVIMANSTRDAITRATVGELSPYAFTKKSK